MVFPSCFRTRVAPCLAAALATTTAPASALTLADADVCVYGGTSGGVAAAVQAARMGCRVVIVEPGRHLGGMSSSGLGVTDIGPHGREYIGGISREFYRRVGVKYGKAEEVWFEPKVAEEVFEEMASEAGVTVVFGESLNRVEKSGATVRRLTTSTGRVVRASMFIDATYEGDLMAAAGVTWVMGREPNSLYGESLNGVRSPTPLISGRRIDPFVVPSQPGSGLIALVRRGPASAPGTGDPLLQAFNYRLCLTNVPANRMPIDPPPDYDAARYELLARYIQSGPAPGKPAARPEAWILDDIIDVQTLIPNGKTDINAGCPVSTDYHRGNDGYIAASPEARAAIAREHENHIRGLLHFLRTDPRVPVNVREEMATWGLARDEFADSGHWPRQLYVREARRMVGDFVMTDRHGRGLESAPDGIGLAAYWLDSHSFQLLEVGGEVRHEGGFFTSSPLYPPKPYPIAFRSLVPKKSEVTNLAAPFCLSATHACFASLRMEPVFMITSQAAAAAAALAIDSGTAIQDVPVELLQTLLAAEGQVLSLTAPPQADGSVVVDTENTSAVSLTGSWTPSTSVAGFQGTQYLTDGNTGQGTKSATFHPILPTAGDYKVALAYRAFSNRARAVPVTLTHDGGTTGFVLDQRVDAGSWKELGIFSCPAGPGSTLQISTTGADGFVIADAARWVPVTPPPPSPPEIAVLAVDPVTVEDRPDTARLIFSRGIKAPTALTVAYLIGGTATAGDDTAPLSGQLTIPANAASAVVSVEALADARIEGNETIVITLGSSTAYVPKPGFSGATVIVRDEAFNGWRHDSFTPTQSIDEAFSGSTADPDRDGTANLLEWALATQPLVPDTPEFSAHLVANTLETSATLRRGLPGGAVAWEFSEDGIKWATPADEPILIGIEALSPTVDRLTWRWPATTAPVPTTLARVRVSR